MSYFDTYLTRMRRLTLIATLAVVSGCATTNYDYNDDLYSEIYKSPTMDILNQQINVFSNRDLL